MRFQEEFPGFVQDLTCCLFHSRLVVDCYQMKESTNTNQQLRCVWLASALALRQARELVSDWLLRVNHHELDQSIVLCVNELLANARNAAAPTDAIILELVNVADDGVIVTVTNPSSKHLLVDSAFPDPSQSGGRGLAIVSRLANSLETTTDDGSLSVVATFG